MSDNIVASLDKQLGWIKRTGVTKGYMGGTQNYLISGPAMHAGLVCPRLEKKRSL